MSILNILLIDPTATGGAQGSGIMSFLPLLLVMVVFFFFFIRPQMKKAKEQKKFREALKKGDKVITIGGIHAKVYEVKDATLVVEISDNVRIEIEKSGVVNDATQIGQNK